MQPNLLAGVAWVATIKTAVNPVTWPSLLGVCDRTVTCGVLAKVNLIFWQRHVCTAGRCIVNFVIAVGLRILVEDESWHFLLL